MNKQSDSRKASTANDEMTKVLIVDDHPIVRYGVARIINDEPDMLVCGEAGEGTGVVDIAKSLNPDVIVLDISMSGALDGLKLSKVLRSQYPHIRILILSMHNENVYAQKALKSGANGYIMKEESSDNLVDALRTVLRGDIYVSQQVKKNMLTAFATSEEDQETAIDCLSDRERQVFYLVGAGYSNKVISEKLGISVKTIETHRSRMKMKLGIKNTPQLVLAAAAWAEHEGIAPPA